MAESKGTYWDDFKKYWSAFYDYKLSEANTKKSGEEWDKLSEEKKRMNNFVLMQQLRDKVLHPSYRSIVQSRLGGGGGNGQA